jgi:glycosyltransferase involved in cell wall biosynthesis
MKTSNQIICLNMIVKNEAPVIRRCLDSVRPIIDRWVIVDTGSTDGTQEIIREHLRDLPGELHERPWRDFAHNRSEALQLAREKGDYTLIIDADDTLEISPDTVLPPLSADSYSIEIRDATVVYSRTQLVRSALPWRYEGVLHEYVTCDGAGPCGQLSGIRMRRNHDGARRRDPETYRRDAAVLEAALRTETNQFLLARYRFYLAQSYRDCRELERALEHYLVRAKLGFWQEEVFISLYSAAQLKQELGRPDQEVIDAYLLAADAAPARTEALHGASRFCRFKGRNKEGYQIAKRGIGKPLPRDALFLESWIYEYGLLDEYAVNAYWAGHYRESLDACLRILAGGKHNDIARISANARFALEKLNAPDAGVAAETMLWPEGKLVPDVPLGAPALRTPRKVAGMVSVITPTRNRSRFLRQALRHFRSQDHREIEWLISDDSTEDAAPLDTGGQQNIHYSRVSGKLPIGTKRNILIEQARGEFIVQFDDDDYYAPHYVSHMVAALEARRADLINLRGWFFYDLPSRFFGYWDLMQKTGPHYCCSDSGVSLIFLSDDNNRGFQTNHLGFGFSYAFRRSVWEATPFPDIDWNEDGAFARCAQADFVVDGIHVPRDNQGETQRQSG